MEIKENEVGYQFSADPLNLMACCDLNCRSMLWTLVQLSSYYGDKDGWFFRTNEDLRAQSLLSENLVRATLSTFYRLGLVDVQTVGKGRSKTPNKFKLNLARFKDWEKYTLEDCIKHPDLRIETDKYKATGWQPSYLNKSDIETVTHSDNTPQSLPIPSLSEDNINNIEIIKNKENKLSEGSKQIEVMNNTVEAYKKREDKLMDKLYHVTTWTDFKTFRKQISELISTASSEKIAEKTKKRFTSIAEGKIKFLKTKISKEPYNSFYDEFYREYDCGWLGKENKRNRVQLKAEEEDPHADLREIFRINGWGEPDIAKYGKQKQEGQDFSPIDDDNLPF